MSFVPGKTYIPPSAPSISDDDIENVVSAAKHGWFTEHRNCNLFANALGDFVGKTHVQLCNSGSSAVLLAMSVLNELNPNKMLVATCAVGFPTTVFPIYQTGKVPIFIDIDPATLSPDLVQLEDVVLEYGDALAGAIFTHTLGIPYDECRVRELLGDRFYIVDSCDALGANVRGFDGRYHHVGVCSDITTFSFFPAHHITTEGEGGALAMGEKYYYDIARSVANWGRDCYCRPGENNVCGKRFSHTGMGKLPDGYDHKYVFSRLGYNLKMTELQGAMGYSQIQRIDEFIERRLVNYQALFEGLFELPELRLVPYPVDTMPSPFGFPVLVDGDFTNDLIQYLEDHKIGTRRIFAGNITLQPVLQSLPLIKRPLPSADWITTNAFWVGCHPSITEEMISYMVYTFKEYFK